jgi:hypothetical protein
MLAKDELGCLYVGQQNHWPNILEIKPAFVVMIGDFFLRIKTDYNAILRYFWKKHQRGNPKPKHQRGNPKP